MKGGKHVKRKGGLSQKNKIMVLLYNDLSFDIQKEKIDSK